MVRGAFCPYFTSVQILNNYFLAKKLHYRESVDDREEVDGVESGCIGGVDFETFTMDTLT
jgi:hypothetical protein